MSRSKRSKGLKDEAYKTWIRSFCCIVCWLCGTGEWEIFCGEPDDIFGMATHQKSATESAHVGARGLSQKCSDRETIPLCAEHHLTGKDAHHVLGKKFWEHHGLNRAGLIKALNDRYAVQGNGG